MNLDEYKEKMEQATEYLNKAYSEIRAGRANPAIINNVMVSYYGVPTPINQIAGISVPEARMILIQPWDQNLLREIEKALNEANLGISPINDGKVIRLVFPELTEERRIEISKDVKRKQEDSKITIRNIRREANDNLLKAEKEENLSEDEVKRTEDRIQDLTDDYTKKIDEMAEQKEKEIMTV